MAATIEIVQQPDPICYYPVENCIKIVVDASGHFVRTGIPAQACLTFNSINFWAAGTYTFVGQELVVGTGTGEVNLVTGTFAQRANAFEAWLRQNGLFALQTNISNSVGATLAITCVFFLDPVEQPADVWVFDVPVQANLSEFIGQTALIEDNFKFLYQLFQVNSFGDESPVCPLQCVTPLTNRFNAPIELPIDVSHDLSPLLETTIPDDLAADIVYDDSISGQYFLKVGYSQQAVGECAPIFEGFVETNRFCVINQAFALESGDSDDRKLLYQTPPGGVGRAGARFLTSAPNPATICPDDYDWLWYNANYIKATGLNPDLFQSYWVQINFFDQNDTIIGTIFNAESLTDGILIIPAGPKNVLNITNSFTVGSGPPSSLAGVCRYTINISARINIVPSIVPLSQQWEYRLKENCCCSNPIYFLDNPGGYTRMPFDCVESIEFIDDATEICLDTQCPDYTQELVEGRAYLNKKGFTAKTLALKRWPKTEENLRMFKNFKASERKFEIFQDYDGVDQRRIAITAPGTTQIWLKDGVLTVTIQILEAQYHKHISER